MLEVFFIALVLASPLIAESIRSENSESASYRSSIDQSLSESNDAKFIIQIDPSIHMSQFLEAFPALSRRIESYVSFGIFQAAYGSLDHKTISYLANSNLVLDITPNVDVHILEVQVDAPRHLARLSQTNAIDDDDDDSDSEFEREFFSRKSDGRDGRPLDYVYDPSGGKGVDVYVLDSGISGGDDYEFGNRIKTAKDFTGEGDGDKNGHGTCVAGVIGSQSYGVSKKVNLIDVKVINKHGKGKLLWLLEGIKFAVDNQLQTQRPSLINISLGTQRNSILNRAVYEAIAAGIPVVVSAGNSDSSACRTSPASVKSVLTIGAFDDRYDSIASFSNWGQCVDAFAPGVNVKSVGLYNDRNGNDPYIYYSGTSMASAMGSGLVAYFMGMGDGGHGAVERVRNLRVKGNLARSSFYFRPLTRNLILFNNGGDPLW